MPHLLVAISSHGFGHLAQVAPVLNRLRQMIPNIRITLRTTLPETLLRQRISGDFAIQAVADDFGMVQSNALEVDIASSLTSYRQLHEHWTQQLARVAKELESAGPDAVFADVPYLTLAAADKADIPSIAMCCLNWHGILQGYVKAGDEAQDILAHMQQAYASAEVFLRPEPFMPMPGLNNLRDIGVVALAGDNRRNELLDAGLVGAGEQVVLIAMGGIDHRMEMDEWPIVPGRRYIVPAAWQVKRHDCVSIEECNMDFSDLLASSDAIITKPGYGTFAEAALMAIPVLYVRRGDWPEEPYLIEWLQENAKCCEIARDALEQGDFEGELQQLLTAPGVRPVTAGGVDEAAAILASFLAG